MRTIFFVVLSFILSHTSAHAQRAAPVTREGRAPFVLGVVNKFMSASLSEERTLNVYLPDGYDKDTATRYPVVYLLDGSADEDFIHIVGLVQFLTMIQVMPKTIVIGIANVDRKRDFTYPSTVEADRKLVPTSGGSAKFIAFLEHDLQPYVTHKYRTSGERTIIGQSLGGLLATEVLLKKPELFNRYIIVSPSLWWDKESLLQHASAHLKDHNYTGIKAYLSVGSEGDQMIGDANRLIDDMRKVIGLSVIAAPLPEENHLTILHRSVYKAFEELNKK